MFSHGKVGAQSGGPYDSPMRSLMIVVEENHAVLGSIRPIVYGGGGYEGARGTVSSWIKDGDMVYSHHQCLRGPMLPLLLDGETCVVEMLIE